MITRARVRRGLYVCIPALSFARGSIDHDILAKYISRSIVLQQFDDHYGSGVWRFLDLPTHCGGEERNELCFLVVNLILRTSLINVSFKSSQSEVIIYNLSLL